MVMIQNPYQLKLLFLTPVVDRSEGGDGDYGAGGGEEEVDPGGGVDGLRVEVPVDHGGHGAVVVAGELEGGWQAWGEFGTQQQRELWVAQDTS